MNDKLSNKSIRATDFRKKVLHIFEKYNQAITVNQIERDLGEHDRVTLYRTLKTFTDKGLIHEVALPNEDKKLALCEADCSADGHQHEHIHFKCKTCEGVFCKEVDKIPSIQLDGFSIDKIEINITGVCDNCL